MVRHFVPASQEMLHSAFQLSAAKGSIASTIPAAGLSLQTLNGFQEIACRELQIEGMRCNYLDSATDNDKASNSIEYQGIKLN